MELIKSYALDQSQQDKVEVVLKEYSTKHASFNQIVCESEIDAGAFFEHEFEEDERCK